MNEPEPVEVPADLAALGIEVDAAVARWDAANADWQSALIAVARAEAALSRHTGTPSASERRALEDAKADEWEARAEYDDASEALGMARVAYNDLAGRIQHRALMDAYQADQEAQAAQREVARQVSRAAGRRRGLRAIKARVSGSRART